MSQPQRWALLVVAVALAAGTLTVGATTEGTVVDQPKTVTVTDKDRDKEVRLAPGDLLIVRLDAPSGEGYLWQITRNNKEQLKPLDKAPLDRVGKGKPSNVEQQVYYLRAEAAGVSDLQLDYRFAKDKDAKPAATFKVKVKIEK